MNKKTINIGGYEFIDNISEEAIERLSRLEYLEPREVLPSKSENGRTRIDTPKGAREYFRKRFKNFWK